MPLWKLEKKKLKNYNHFDALMTSDQAEALVNDPSAVASHKFFPFITYEKRWTEFAKRGNSGKVKRRPISYAARSDAYIYMRYRQMLSELFEKELVGGPVANSILAYRKIVDPNTKTGKCNIHFAAEAFAEIKKQNNCCAIAVDISDFFGCIDHQLLETRLLELIKAPKLPPDLLTVFTNITKYSSVKLQKVYERLGFFGILPSSPIGKAHRGYLKPKHEIKKQLCSVVEFREKIAGGNTKPSIIQKNPYEYGIPQGSPISDLLANVYLYNFDLLVQEEVTKIGGRYTRYSDDILIIAPVSTTKALELETWLRKLIANYGAKLKIKQAKSLILKFETCGRHQSFRLIYDGKSKSELVRFKYEELVSKGRDLLNSKSLNDLKQEYDRGRIDVNGFDYLGFRFDGKGIYLRDSTYSNLRRKIRLKCRSSVRRFVRERPNTNKAQLLSLFGNERKKLQAAFGKVRYFEASKVNPQSWTFTTYSKKISEIVDPNLNQVNSQLKKLKQTIYFEADKAFEEITKKMGIV
jgi:Reverse transcriptase (RNA-dependent DNA polymerase)